VISRELAPGELRWCADCRGFVEDVLKASASAGACGLLAPALPSSGIDLEAHLSRVEQSLIEAALSQAGTVAAAARLLRLNRTTLVEKIKRFSGTNPRLAASRERTSRTDVRIAALVLSRQQRATEEM